MSESAPTFDAAPPPPDRAAAETSGAKAGDWAPKRRLTLEAARQHSRRVRIFQFVLLGIAALLLLELVRQFAMRPASTFEDPDPSQTVTMTKPRYIGRTADGLPYTLTADTATRSRSAPDELNLAMPVLDFFRVKGAESSTVDALTGLYNSKLETLELRQEVVLETDDGNVCRTTHARLQLDTKTIEGDEPIECTGAFGVVRGNGYEILDDYRTFVFKDGMSGTLEPDESGPVSAGSAAGAETEG